MCAQFGFNIRMLTEIYIEALLVDEELAEQVWAAWYSGEIDDLSAWAAWLIVALRCNSSNPYRQLSPGPVIQSTRKTIP